MTKQRIIGILSLLALLIPAAVSLLKGATIDYGTLLPAALTGLGLILHPPTDGSAPAVPPAK